MNLATDPGRATLAAPAVARLMALAPLDAAAAAALAQACGAPRGLGARRELVGEGQAVAEPLLLLDGWAARVRLLEDGRRQVLGFLLPGDVIGAADHAGAVAPASVVAVTAITVCPAPPAGASPALARAYALGRALDERLLLAQVTRLGCMNAHERLADLLLELLDRLAPVGLAAANRFSLPVTQEMIGEALGLTTVHVNRTLQLLRSEGFIHWKGGELELPDPAALRRSVMRAAPRPLA